MSKVTKGVARAIGKIQKGVMKAVKKVAKSKLGKIILVAAAVYFGGAALMGAMGTTTAAGAAVSGLEGAMTGISNAWTSLGTATSQALSGNFANAGSALSTGIQGGSATMVDGALVSNLSSAVQPAVTTPGKLANGLPINPTDAQINDYLFKAGTTPPRVPGAGGGGWFSGLSPLGQAAVVSGGTQLIGQTVSGIGNQMAARDARLEREQAQARYKDNIGTSLWGDVPADPTGGVASLSADPTEQSRLIAERYGQQLRSQPMGLIGQSMWSPRPPYRG